MSNILNMETKTVVFHQLLTNLSLCYSNTMDPHHIVTAHLEETTLNLTLLTGADFSRRSPEGTV